MSRLLHESAEVQLAEAIIAAARDLAASIPPPRGAPFFYLDAVPRYGFDVLGSLSARGIFRKYEFVLEIGSRLGARTRWLATHLGCRLVGIDPSPQAVAAAQLLTSRARMGDRVTFHVGHAACLPLPPRRFTHVWLLDPERCPPTTDTLREAYRVLRPGGYVAIHGVSADGPDSTDPSTDPSRLLQETGFIDLTVCRVQLTEVPDIYRLAAARLRVSAGLRDLLARSNRGANSSICLQILGRRPA
jgi:SAM-dependent methyltransferase